MTTTTHAATSDPVMASADANDVSDAVVAKARDGRGLYAALHPQLVAAGCFRPAPGLVLLDLVATVLGSIAAFVIASQAPWWAAAPLFVLGSLLFFRVGWAMHDAAHGNVFLDRRRDEVLAWICCGIMGEFLSGWRYGHNLHHKAPNVRGIDKDKSERWNPALRFTSPWAAFIHVLVLARKGRIILPRNLLLMCLRDGYYAKTHAPQMFRREFVVVVATISLQIALFVALFGDRLGVVGAAALYLVHTTIGALYLNAIFAGNHYDSPAFDPPEHLALDAAALQVVTASNYRGGAWISFWCGGLEKQIEHHLFPRLPRRHLHTAAPIVRAFCAEHGLPYVERDLSAALTAVVRYHVIASPAVTLDVARAGETP